MSRSSRPCRSGRPRPRRRTGPRPGRGRRRAAAARARTGGRASRPRTAGPAAGVPRRTWRRRRGQPRRRGPGHSAVRSSCPSDRLGVPSAGALPPRFSPNGRWCVCWIQQRGRDSNPRLTSLPATAFKAVPIGHSGTPPDGRPGAAPWSESRALEVDGDQDVTLLDDVAGPDPDRPRRSRRARRAPGSPSSSTPAAPRCHRRRPWSPAATDTVMTFATISATTSAVLGSRAMPRRYTSAHDPDRAAERHPVGPH